MAVLNFDLDAFNPDENGRVYIGDYATIPDDYAPAGFRFEVWYIDMLTHDESDPNAQLVLATTDEDEAAAKSDELNADRIAAGLLSSAVDDLEERRNDPFLAMLKELGLF